MVNPHKGFAGRVEIVDEVKFDDQAACPVERNIGKRAKRDGRKPYLIRVYLMRMMTASWLRRLFRRPITQPRSCRFRQ